MNKCKGLLTAINDLYNLKLLGLKQHTHSVHFINISKYDLIYVHKISDIAPKPCCSEGL